jgi:hypothetical protein
MLAEDLSVFMDVSSAGFAQTATLPGNVVVPVIFDNAYARALGSLIETTGPQCVIKTADAGTVVQGTAIVINATTYKVTSVQHDGTGMTTLLLRL